MSPSDRSRLPAAHQYKSRITPLETTQLRLRNPWVIAFWSAMFPGAGHLLLSKNLRALFFFLWEIFINTNSNINVAILYSFTGRFNMAKNILNKNWMLFYVPVFVFAIWDSYRTTVELNRQYIPAGVDAGISPPQLPHKSRSTLSGPFPPWSSAIWSSIMPGAGQLAIGRITPALFIFTVWLVIVYYSGVFPGIHHAFTGSLIPTGSVLDRQWFLNLPTFYVFAIYDAYVNTVESNILFAWKQSKFLVKNYQSSFFNLPFKNTAGGKHMYMISTFQHSSWLEKAITDMQIKGIAKENILAVPLNKKSDEPDLSDPIPPPDDLNMMNLPFMLAALLMLFGSIYGFILAWGPILWGLIGLCAGFAIGLSVNRLIMKKRINQRNSKYASEVVLIIQCKEHQMETVKDMLWANNALGVRKLDLDS